MKPEHAYLAEPSGDVLPMDMHAMTSEEPNAIDPFITPAASSNPARLKMQTSYPSFHAATERPVLMLAPALDVPSQSTQPSSSSTDEAVRALPALVQDLRRFLQGAATSDAEHSEPPPGYNSHPHS